MSPFFWLHSSIIFYIKFKEWTTVLKWIECKTLYIILITWQVQSYSLTNSSWFTLSFFVVLDFFSCCNSTMNYSCFCCLVSSKFQQALREQLLIHGESCASSFYFYLTPLALCFSKIICLGFVGLSCAIHNVWVLSFFFYLTPIEIIFCLDYFYLTCWLRPIPLSMSFSQAFKLNS